MAKSERPATKRQMHTALDHMLIKAKTDGKEVIFHLALETSFTKYGSHDGAYFCKGVVENVDVYSIKVNIEGRGVWINKTFIVGVEE